MFELRVVGNRIKRLELFFKVSTKSSVRILVENQIELLKKNHMRIAFKNMKNKYVARIGFFTRLVIQYANTNYYKEAIVKSIGLNQLDFEIKKEMVYKQNYKAYVLVMYAVLLKREEADFKLKSIKIGKGKYRKYISFKGTDLNNCIGSLHLNEMTNVKAKFDLLEEVNADEIVTYQGKES